MFTRGSRGDPASANASDDNDGCDVMPPMMLTAPSTTSTPASMAARYELMALPAASCMCRCSGGVGARQVRAGGGARRCAEGQGQAHGPRFLEPLGQHRRPARPQNARQVLERQQVAGPPVDLLGHVDVVLEVVLRARRIGD